MGEADLVRVMRKGFPEGVTSHNDNLVRKRGKKFEVEALRQKAAWRIPEDRMVTTDRKQ